MAASNIRATLLAYLILWLSVFNFNGAYARTLKKLDQPIAAISSGEFGLPEGLSVTLHSYAESIGPDAEAAVRRAYRGDDLDDENVAVELDERGLWSFLWSATKVFINPMSWTSGIQLAGLACQALGWWTSAPSWVTYTCNSIGIVSTMWSVWDGRADLATAYNDWRNEGSYRGNLESLQLLPYYRDYAQPVDNVGRSVKNITRGQASGYYDWSVLHPHLANRTVINAKSGNASILHDVGRNYTIITLAHVINSTNEKPLLVQRSLNGTLLGSPVSMFFVNGTGSSAGFASHHAFGAPLNTTKTTTKRDSGNCDGFGNDSGNIYASDTTLCGGDGTETEDGITGIYYGMDCYGTESQWKEYDADVGGQYPESNGAWEFASDLSSDTQNRQWWRTCLCDQESGDYSWTGALQYTWNGGFNGYNDCYSGVCGGAS